MKAERNAMTGERIPIKINGQEIVTVIDSRGVQRLPHDPSLDAEMNGYLNRRAVLAARGIVSEDFRRFVYQNIGYSVCGYSEIFPCDEIENPLW